MKKVMIGILMLVFVLCVQSISAYDDTCGVNNSVSYTIEGDTISFYKVNSGDAVWGSDCGAVFKEDESIKKVIIADEIRVENAREMFKGFGYVEEMDLSNFDVSDVTDMSGMFEMEWDDDLLEYKTSLSSLDVSGWDTSNVTEMKYLFRGCRSLTALDVSGWDTSNVTEMKYLFRGCRSLSSLDVSGWDTSNVTDMSGMFLGCSSLAALDVSGWDTSNVTDMSEMFYSCSSLKLTTLDVSGWDTSNVTDMEGMFSDCFYLKALDVSGWDTSNVTDMSGMFLGCISLAALDVSAWDTSNVTIMRWMFGECRSLSNLNLSGWDTSSVTDMSDMFAYCSSLTTLNVSGWDTSNVTDMYWMFYNCSSLTTLDVSGWDTSSVTNMSFMFAMEWDNDLGGYKTSLTNLDVSGWDTTNVTGYENMFEGCDELGTLTFGEYEIKQNLFESLPKYDAEWTYTVQGATALNPLDIGTKKQNNTPYGSLFEDYDPDRMAGTWTAVSETNDDICGTNVSYTIEGNTISFYKAGDAVWGSDCGAVFKEDERIKKVIIADEIRVENAIEMFKGFAYVEEMDLSNFDVSDVTDMSGMFAMEWANDLQEYKTSLTSLDVSGWDTSSVTDMNAMFNGCKSLSSLDVSGWDTSNVTDMNWMFGGCSSLTSLEVSNWDTSNVADMHHMFHYCSSLTELDVSDWDTSKVIDMSAVFNGCRSLSSLDVSGWDTSNAADMNHMFQGCRSLSGLDVSGWNTSKVTNMNTMFADCSSMTTLDLSGWDTSSVTNVSYMFYYCSNLSSLDVSGWETSNVSNMMGIFNDCSVLNTLTLGINKLNPDIFDTLPAGNDTWYYKVQSASNPLDLNTAKADGALFEEYDPNTMAGTWSAWEVPATAIRIQNSSGRDITGETINIDSSSYQLEGIATPAGAFQSFIWSSDPADTAVVYRAGNVSFKKSGTVTITANAADGSGKSAWVKLTSETTNTCGTNVTYAIEGDTIRFYKVNSGDAVWGSDCGAVFKDEENIKNVIITDEIRVENAIDMFSGFAYAEEMDLSNFDVSDVTDMSGMFAMEWDDDLQEYKTSLTSLDVSGWDTSSVTDMNAMFNGCKSLTSLNLSGWDTSNVTDVSYMFNGCSSLTTLDVSGWDTSNVTLMNNMFSDCSSLSRLDVSGWDTSNVMYMGATFQYCSSLTTLDVSGWETSNVMTMGYVFNRCSSLTALDVSGWNTSNVTDMSDMFYDCSSLTALDVSGWDTTNVTGYENMFEGCDELGTLTFGEYEIKQNLFESLPKYDAEWTYTVQGATALNPLEIGTKKQNNTPYGSLFEDYDPDRMAGTWTAVSETNDDICGTNVTYAIEGDTISFSKVNSGDAVWGSDCGAVFKEDESIKKVIIADEIRVENAREMFKGFAYVEEMDLSNFDVSEVTDMSKMFLMEDQYWDVDEHTIKYNTSLKKLDLSGWDTFNVTDMGGMFANCSSLSSLDVRGWDTSNVTDMGGMFANCSSLSSLDVSGWDTSNVTDMREMFYDCSSLTSLDVSGWDTSNVTDMSSMFRFCSSLTTLDVSGWDTSNVTKMSSMFGMLARSSKTSLTSLDLSGWDTSKVTEMGYMFYACSLLSSLEVSGWNTANVTDMEGVFCGCSSLTTLNLSGWDTSNVIDMSAMFSGCISLTALDVSGWNTSNVTNMSWIISDCNSLTSLNVSGWDTSNVTHMSEMFLGCSSLTSLDLSGWDTSNVTYMGSMFYNCSSLTALDVSGWDTSKVTEMGNMFEGCNSLTNLTLGQNILNPDIFETLPHKDDTWYYIAAGAAAGNPIALGTPAQSQTLFTAYNPNTMAGVWSTNKNYSVTINTLTLPSGLRDIRKSAFEGVNTIDRVILPNGVTTIGSRSFADCYRLSYVRMPDSIKNIAEDAFPKSSKLVFVCQSENSDAASYARLHNIFYRLEGPGDALTAKGVINPDLQMNQNETETITTEAARDFENTDPQPVPADEPETVSWDAKDDAENPEPQDVYLDEKARMEPEDFPFAEKQVSDGNVKADDSGLSLFPIACQDCRLPNTGFSSHQPAELPARSKGLVYGTLNISLLIPRFDLDTEIVRIPQTGNSWPVEWLGDQAGLMEGSAIPGEGYSLIAAHNTLNDTAYGPFALLAEMEESDRIFVRTNRDELKSFRVYANKLIKPDDFGTIQRTAEKEPGSLILITCENESADGGYLNRRVVFAKP